MGNNGGPPELVTLSIDGKTARVPKGTNLIKAASSVGIEVPHYCYHPNLSVPGNCRMCQVKVEGQPKLMIACHAQVQEGMKVSTQLTSKEVQDAQAATLEFILINHPLDCTVCDQAGHCKLQDYHYEYNARPSRFIEDKVHKVKAEPLGPHVMLDGERCIMCTRCIRFCDEVTKTKELGLLNRGDRNVIAVNAGQALDNPLSGSVVDLCPVGALTHRDWRFNTRIWFTESQESICPGCSTGCNVKVHARDGQVVQVKARMNEAVNKEWLCDEGRYGFTRFLPAERLLLPRLKSKEASWDLAIAEASKLASGQTLVLVSPDLLLEEYALLKQFLDKVLKNFEVCLAYRERELTSTQAILISPDYACNFRAAEFAGLAQGDLAKNYQATLEKIRSANFKNILLVGERAIFVEDLDDGILAAISRAELSVSLSSDASSRLVAAAQVALPSRSILEKSGLMINRKGRLQYAQAVLEFPAGSEPEWRVINRISEKVGAKLTQAQSDRDLTLGYLATTPALANLRIKDIKGLGVDLHSLQSGTAQVAESQQWR